MTALAWSELETPLGVWLVVGSRRGLRRVVLDSARGRAELAGLARGHDLREDDARLSAAREQLGAYADGTRRTFDLALDVEGTDFQLGVWAALARIPWGEVRTYGELAESVGRPGGARAVGRANGANPVPVVVPCHRVVARDGLGGFTGGLDHKRRLLAHEGHAVQSALW